MNTLKQPKCPKFVLLIFLSIITIGYVAYMFELQYEKVKESYPELTRWEFMIYRNYLRIEPPK